MSKIDDMQGPLMAAQDALVALGIACGFGANYGKELFESVEEKITDHFNFEGIDPFAEDEE